MVISDYPRPAEKNQWRHDMATRCLTSSMPDNPPIVEPIRGYVALLDLALEAIAFGDPEVTRQRTVGLRSLSAQLADNNLGAREVIELHVSSLSASMAGCAPTRMQALQREGRLQVLELMGHLADTYRARTQAVTADSPASSDRQRHALGLNDTVVQDLVAAQTHLGLNNETAAADALTAALSGARHLLADLLGDGPVRPGDLSRPWTAPATMRRLSPPTSREGLVSVLLADDDANIRTLLTMILEESGGYQVIGEVSDTPAAVDLARALQPQLILLDVSMPGSDGLTAVPLLAEVAPAVCIVVVSGFSAAQMAATARAQGAHGYLEKADLGKTLLPALHAALALR